MNVLASVRFTSMSPLVTTDIDTNRKPHDGTSTHFGLKNVSKSAEAGHFVRGVHSVGHFPSSQLQHDDTTCTLRPSRSVTPI